MGEHGAPAGLSIPELFDGSRCDQVIFSKAKRGPRVRRWCKTCGAFLRSKACALSQGDAHG
jgi:hypothetical protein